MRLLSLLIILTLTHFHLEAQSEAITTSELDSMYVETIQMQYFFLVNGTLYVEKDQNSERLENLKELHYLKFLNTENLINEAIRKKESLTIIRLTHKVISNDTIDINLGCLSLTAKRGIYFNHGIQFKKAEFKLNCGGTEGYKPTCRFVFNKRNQIWEKQQNT